jgi:hypothetical protein
MSDSAAPGPALGYLAQVDQALVSVLSRMDTEIDFAISIESLDDVVFHDPAGPAIALLQIKHHVSRQAGLGDASPDLWRSIHNWIEGPSSEAALYLLTTASAHDGTVAALLRQGAGRDIVRAHELLSAVAKAAGNQDNGAYYRGYLALDAPSALVLLSRITVLDQGPVANEMAAVLERAVRKAVPANKRLPLVERLRGWWLSRVEAHLMAGLAHQSDLISVAEVEEQLHAIAQSLRDDDLPIDFSDLMPPEDDAIRSDLRIFVDQLRLIMMGHARLRQCIYDHNRAFLQRSQWQRENLLKLGELAIYDQMLQDEWRRHFTPVADSDRAEDEEIRWAQDMFHALDTRPLPRIRTNVAAGYVANGSLHILADRLLIGWHPRWVEYLRDRLEEVQEPRAGRAG